MNAPVPGSGPRERAAAVPVPEHVVRRATHFLIGPHDRDGYFFPLMPSFPRCALVGAVLWLLALAWTGIPVDGVAHLALSLLTFGILVTTPLALDLAAPATARGRWNLLCWLQLPCAACVVLSSLLAPGAAAFVLSLPWLLFTLLVALCGSLRLVERGRGPLSEIAVDAGLVFLAVGGVWTVATRAGSPLLGFGEPWVALTAAHFHFAGLVLPVVTGCAARRLPGRHGALASVGVIVGVPAVAVGITVGAGGGGAGGSVEWLCASVLVLAATLTVGLLARLALAASQRPAALLLGLAAVALLAGMSLVLVYATSRWGGIPRLDLLDMVRSHAPLNVFGFALAALLGLRLLPRLPSAPGMQVVLPWLFEQPDPEAWRERAFGPETRPGQRGYAADRHEAELPAEPPGPPLAHGPFRAAAAAALGYRSFPAHMLMGLRPVQPVVPGEVVPVRYRLLPFVHLVFAARVVEVFDDVFNDARDGVHRAGFTYRTLAGHPECGVETFAIEKDLATGAVRAVIAAESRPGNWLTWALRPLCRRLQLAAGRAAVRNLAMIAARGE